MPRRSQSVQEGECKKMNFWSELIKSIVGYGVFAMLFVFLFFYQLKDSAKREESYRETIEALADSLQVISDVKQQVEELARLISESISYFRHLDDEE